MLDNTTSKLHDKSVALDIDKNLQISVIRSERKNWETKKERKKERKSLKSGRIRK